MAFSGLREPPVPKHKKKDDRKSVRIEFMVTEDWAEAFREEAKSWGIDLSQYVRIACEEKRRNDQAKKPPA